jgi:hypothetical protein
VDHRGLLPALDGLDEDPHGRERERGAVRERREHLGAPVAVRAVPRARAASDALRDEREGERRGVGEHVPRVRDQREAVRPEADAGLHDHERRGEARRPTRAAAIGVDRSSAAWSWS